MIFLQKIMAKLLNIQIMPTTLFNSVQLFDSSRFVPGLAYAPVQSNFLKTSVGVITDRFTGSESGLFKTQVEMYCSSS